MKTIRKIIELTRPYWPRVFLGIVLSLLASGITAAIAWVVKPALDGIMLKEQYEYVKLLPLAVILLFITKGFLQFGQTYIMASAGMKLVRDTRNRLYDHLLYMPVSYFNKESSSIVISRILSDVSALKALISTVIKSFVVEIPTVLLLLGIAFYRRWDLTLILLILFPFIGYSARKFGKGIKKKKKRAQRKIASVTNKVGEAVQGLRIIKVFNREAAMSDKFRSISQSHYREMLRVVRLKEFTKLVINISTGFGIALAIWYGSSLVAKGIITPGDLASILVAVYMLFTPIKKLGDAYTSLQDTRASIDRIDKLFDTKLEEHGDKKVESFRGVLKFNNVSFSYPGTGQAVLKDLNLEISRGETVAIVGQSGAGKSTLVDLIPVFYKASSGTITIDGTDINDIDLSSLRKLMGNVTQDIMLFNDTVRENIAIGKKDAEESEIIQAAKLAYADEFIMEFPDQYDTVMGERGLRLSGGQRQRIALARAVLKNPPLLILDEATSSLDSVSERLIQKALEEFMKDRTTIVIAHRLSTIQNADKIAVLDKGKIIDIGTHEALMERSTAYTNLYNAFTNS